MVIFFRIIAFIILLLPAIAHSAAWTLKKGESQIISTFSLYTSRYFIDNEGRRHRQGKFTRLQANAYTEIGLAEDVTLGLVPEFTYATQRNRLNAGPSVSGLDIFLRKRAYQKNNLTLSLQNLLRLPGFYGDDEAQVLGEKVLDLEMRGLMGYGFTAWKQAHFADVELAYRYRDGTVSDELRLDGTLGLRPREKWLLLGQMFNTYALETGVPAVANAGNTTDYRLVKLQTSAAYEINPRLSVQAGLMHDAYSRNTGKGNGLFTALWVRF